MQHRNEETRKKPFCRVTLTQGTLIYTDSQQHSKSTDSSGWKKEGKTGTDQQAGKCSD